MSIVINKEQVNEVMVNGSYDIPFSIKSDEDSKESKSGTLRFKLVDVPLAEIITSSLKDKRINWQAIARKKFEQVKPGIVVVDYKGGRVAVDPMSSTKAYLASLSPEERVSWLKEQGLI